MPRKKAPEQQLAGARLSPEMFAQLTEQAQREDRTQAAVIRRALRLYFETYGPDSADQDASTAA